MNEDGQANELLQSIIDAADMGLAVYKAIRDKSNSIVDFIHELVNRKDILARGQDFTGRLLSERDIDGLQHIDRFKEVIESRQPGEYTLKAQSRDVQEWFHFSNVPLGNDRLLHTWQDITAQEGVEQQLDESQELLAAVLHNTASGVVILKPVIDEKRIIDFEYVYANGQTLQSLSHKDLVGRHFLHEFPLLRDSELFKDYVKVLETGNDLQREIDMTPYGINACLQVYARKRTETLLVTYVDITDRKKAALEITWLKDEKRMQAEIALRESERMRATMESAIDFAIITMNSSRKITGWNKGAEYIFGYSEAEMLGEYGDRIFTPEDRMAGLPDKEQAQADKEGRANDERWHLRKDGSRVFMSGVMVPMRSNILPGYVKIARDITDRKLQEQQKDEFIGTASHELKTPVTSMKAYAEIVLERLLADGNIKDGTLLLRLNEQIDRLTKLINDLLDTTRISEGKLQLTIDPVDINELLRERIEEIKYTSDHKFRLIMGALPTVYVDRERIGQVISNLLSNAIKYSPRTTTITITTATTGNDVVVSVKDEGYGISTADLQKVFERFCRVIINNMNTYPGMGLGLYISAQIIQRHGGTISVESREGAGSTFSFTLPVKSIDTNGTPVDKL